MKECPSKAHAQHRRTCRQVAPLAVLESLDSDTCNDIDLKMPNSKNKTVGNNAKSGRILYNDGRQLFVRPRFVRQVSENHP